MSALKPCPVLQSNDGTIRERCATCPNRKPVSLEGLANWIDEKVTPSSVDSFERGKNTAFREASKLIRAYEKELNNG